MTTADDSLLDMAVPYALHAMTDAERDEIDRLLAGSDAAVPFYDEVRAIREAMAEVSVVTAAEPPAALRGRILGAARRDSGIRERRWRTTAFAAAAAVAIGLGAIGVGIALRPASQPSAEQQIFAAPDVRTVSGALPPGGSATLVYSRDRHAGVLVMNDVPPPAQGTVYQMWLINGSGAATSAGTMDTAAVAPSTTAVLPELGDSTELAFTVEPGAGSTQPTGKVFARLPLT